MELDKYCKSILGCDVYETIANTDEAILFAYKEKLTTPLHIAVIKGDKYNFMRVCWPDFVNSKDKFGDTPLHLACEFVRIEIVKFLLSRSVDPNIANNYKMTPIFYACGASTKHNGKFEIVKELICNNANVNVTDETGGTPLHYASEFNDKCDIVELLIENGANVFIRDDNGNTPIKDAIENGKGENALMLLKCYDKSTRICDL